MPIPKYPDAWETFVGSQSPLEFMQESTGKRKRVFTRDEVKAATRKYADVDDLARMYRMPDDIILDDVRHYCDDLSLTKPEANKCLAGILAREIESGVTIRAIRKKK